MIELSYIFAFLFAVIACLRLLHLTSKAEWPELFYNGTAARFINSDPKKDDDDGLSPPQDYRRNSLSMTSFVANIIQHTPILTRP